MKINFQGTIDPPWINIKPLRVGAVPLGLSTPDCYLTIETATGPWLRIDLYGRSGEESYAFEDAIVWRGFVAIGWGSRFFLVQPDERMARVLDLEGYFGHLYPEEDYLLVASGERLHRIEPDGSVLWTSERLSIDGVLVDQVSNGIIEGQGEWDPPDGWRPFRVSLSSGQPQ